MAVTADHIGTSSSTVALSCVSVTEYLAMRSYFVEVVRWAYETDARLGSARSKRLRARVDQFVAAAGTMLGSNRASSLSQVVAAQDAGLTHCEVIVDGPTMLDLTNELLRFLHAIEELRQLGPEETPAPPPGMRAFILACQAQLEAAI